MHIKLFYFLINQINIFVFNNFIFSKIELARNDVSGKYHDMDFCVHGNKNDIVQNESYLMQATISPKRIFYYFCAIIFSIN